MSIKAMNWAWEQSLPCSPKLILMALADAADDSGDCWPKVKTIARKCGVSERTVQRVMKDLIADGLLELTPRFNHEGRQVSNNYRLLLDVRYPEKLSPSVQNGQGRVAPVSSSGVTQLRQGQGDKARSYQEPPIEPKDESSSASLRFHSGLSGEGRERCSALLVGMGLEHAQRLLDELGCAMDRKLIRTTPEQWLRGAVRIQSRGGRLQSRVAGLSEAAYREALVLKGLSPDDATAIAAKTVRQGS
ncbi:helix-turn-helix domain-containing protein [Metapseudomonas resinovorans]|uniref:helix-turn-helix domain-containing protein n=1 Tax=Metapseudomonas resinovorans TaxID=53412 RepID=UPI003B84A9B2